jgi:ectoine hydroxylase-related dioxygenase (phytanoyl-CoA dioxygenase family)
MAKILTQDQIDTYNRDGYIAVRGVYTPAEVRELQEVTEEFVQKSAEVSEHTEVFDIDIKAGHSADNPKLRRIKNPHLHHDAYNRAMRNPKLLDIIEQLIGSDIRHHHTKLNNKAPGGGAQVEWHTDWGFYPATNDDILEIGVAIDPMTVENGCLMVMPGSHKGPAYDHHEDGVFVGAVQMSDVDMESAGQILLEEGDISIHHVRALHGSEPNMSANARRLLLMGYSAADAFPIGGYGDWETWQSYMLRGTGTNVPRFNGAPVRIAEPKPADKGSIFEIQEELSKTHFEEVKPT